MKITSYTSAVRSRTPFRALLAIFAAAMAVQGATISFPGSLPSNNPDALVEITFTTPADVTGFAVFTDSFTSFASPSSGFDPVLWLFDPSMTTQLDKDDDICNGAPGGCNNADPAANRNAEIPNAGDIHGGAFSFSANTQYSLVLSANDQHYCVANTNCNGVFYSTTGWSNNGNFLGLSPNYDVVFSYASTAPKIDAGPTLVTNYPLATTVPEPTSAILLLTGGLFLGWRKMRRV